MPHPNLARRNSSPRVSNAFYCNLGYCQVLTVTIERSAKTVVIKGVPADAGDNCGEYYLSEKMTDMVLAMAEKALRHGAEIEVLDFAVSDEPPLNLQRDIRLG